MGSRVAIPKSVIFVRDMKIESLEEYFSYPVVVKIPDGSFSRGVFKAENRAEFDSISGMLFKNSDIILAQEFMYTDFDWRVGVLNKKPLYVSKYFMSHKHWQIYKHEPQGRVKSGSSKTIPVEDAPKTVIDAALKAAGLIGDGLYGVDIKETDKGALVIEVNDNPNIDSGVEDVVLKDELYRIILSDMIRRIDIKKGILRA